MINKQKLIITGAIVFFCLFTLAGAVSAASIVNNSTVNETPDTSITTGLADTTWPKFQNDLNNTGQSEYMAHKTILHNGLILRLML